MPAAMTPRPPRVAIVHDALVNAGGAERVASFLCEAFPGAPLYTSAYLPFAPVLSTGDVAAGDALVPALANLTPGLMAETDDENGDGAVAPEGVTSLLLSFLWIVSRASTLVPAIDEGWLWNDVQAAWFGGLATTLSEAQDDDAWARVFGAVALADVAAGLSPTGEARTAGLSALATAFRRLPKQQRNELRANWRAIQQGLLKCLGVRPPERLDARRRSAYTELRAQWVSIRGSVQALLASTMEPTTFK